MIPFYLTTALYWIFYIPNDQPGFLAMLLKILPTIALYGAIRFGIRYTNWYQKYIAFGLAASVVGDAALVWDHLFVIGMLAFAVGHFFYIKALNLKGGILGKSAKNGLTSAVVLYGLAGCIWYFLLFPGLQDPILAAGVPVYILWLTTSVWRASTVGDKFILVGISLFMFSDSCIGINLFYAPIPLAQVLIMSTYQVGQYLIAFSAFLPHNSAAEKFRSVSVRRSS